MRFPGRSASGGGADGGVAQPQRRANERVGEILSDSNSELSSIDGDANESATAVLATAKQASAQPTRSRARSSSASSDPDSDRSARASNSSNAQRNAGGSSSGGARRSTRETSGAKIRQLPEKASPTPSAGSRSQQSQSQSMRSARGIRRAASRKWYSDSDNDSDAEARSGGGGEIDARDARGARSALESARATSKFKVKTKRTSHKSEQQQSDDDESKADAKPRAYDSSAESSGDSAVAMTKQRNRDALDGGTSAPTAAAASRREKLKTLGAPRSGVSNAAAAVLSPTSESSTPRSGGTDPTAKRKTGFQKLVAKTFSPFGSRHKSVESPGLDTASAGSGDSARTATADASVSGVSRAKSTGGVLPPQSDVAASPAQRKASVDSTHSSLRSIAARTASNKRQTLSTASATGDVISPLSGTGTSSRGGSMTAHAISDPASGALLNRRTSRLKQSPHTSELSGAPRSLDSPHEAAARRALEAAAAASGTTIVSGGNAGPGGVGVGIDALSPGQRKLAGACLGPPGSGVLLEGWLRQKQRRGVKGMKKWNARYFVLYARTNELRYYADVVQSAWGPIPLGEIGAIALRLIQKIGKPSHPKYRGCRFDITCRNSWGTHYADDYVSSDDENNQSSSNHSASAAAAAAVVTGMTEQLDTGTGTGSGGAKQDRTSTPRSSRMYSLVTDSPQTTVTWMTALDSLLVRSANSPRPDVTAPGASAVGGAASGIATPGSGSKTKRATAASTKVLARRRTSALESETLVLVGAGERVPKPVAFAIKYIYDSTPGVETERFYEQEPDAAKLKTSLKFLNQFSTDATRKPSMEELEAVLDPVTAGAVVKLWLTQLEHPLVPFEMFDDFQALARGAKAAPFTFTRDLKALVDALPRRNFAMLVCVLVHLNDVHEYAPKNHMDAAALAALFTDFVLRPRRAAQPDDADANADASAAAATERELSRALVQEMISSVDAIIDEQAVEEFAEMQ